MLGLASPLWLAGLAALLVPLVIHLWSRRPSRVARVGSIRLLHPGPPPIARSLRLREPWLLAVRSLLLSFLVLLLAGPTLVRREAASPVTWALVAPSPAPPAGGERALLDSLSAAGAEIRRLAPGLPRVERPVAEEPAEPNLWALLLEADRLVPSGSRLVVVAPSDRRHLRGRRPTLVSRVTWVPTAPSPQAAAGPPAEWRIAVFAPPDREDDARYLVAAFRAVGLAQMPALRVERLPLADTAGVSADWIAWLGSAPPPRRLLDLADAGATLLTEAADPSARTADGRLVLAGAASSVRLLRRPPDTVARGAAPLWSDDAGRPVLTVESAGRGRRLRLHVRLHPSWTDLVVRAELPIALARLLDPAPPPSQRIALSQALPRTREAGPRRSAGVDLHWPLWIAVLLLALLERWLARRPAPREALP